MIEFFLKRRVLTNLFTLFVIVLGLYQFMSVKRSAFPEVSFDIVTITTLYPGASPEEVERLVTNPVEETLKAVDNLKKVESYSLEGRSLMVIWLEENMPERNVSRAVNDIQQAVNRVEDLPDEARKPIVIELSSDRPLITLSVAGGTDVARDEFAEKLKDQIEDIPGVSKVEQEGDRAKEIWVEADPKKLLAYQITVGEIASRLREQNVNMSAGTIETGSQELLVRTLGGFETAQDVEGVILRGNDERSFLRVKDVAAVRETFADDKVLAKAAGKPSINLLVRKNRHGDTIELADIVKEIVKERAADAKKQNLELVISDDNSFFVRRRLNVMKSNMLQGAVLIAAALFVFLDWRLALVALLGVPISFGAAMMVAVPMGFTINLLSLLAFIIVLGMLDDDSVVVAENIYRHLEMGKAPFKAAVDGTKEVVLPVLGSVAATSAAFLPFALVEGIMGKFLFMIPVIIIMCFVASLLEAFFILPAHVLDILPFGKPVEEKNESHWHKVITAKYKQALGWCADHRNNFLLIVFGALAVTAVIAGLRLKVVMFPEGLIDQFFVQIEMPRGTSLTETNKAMQQIEDIVMNLPKAELDTVTSTVGQSGWEESVRRGTNLAQARVYLQPQEDRERQTDEILGELRAQFAGIKSIEKLDIEKLRPGPPVGKAVQVKIRGDDTAVLQGLSKQIREKLAAQKGVFDIKDNFEGGKSELRIEINRREAAYAGVSTSEVARHILYSIEGGEATKIRRSKEEVVVKVKLLPQYRNDPDALKKIQVLNNRGQQINMAPLVEFERREGPPYIEHYDFKRAITVTANVDNVNVTSYEANNSLREAFARVPHDYPGYEIVYGGEEEETQKSFLSLRRGFFVAILLDLIILATLFNSYAKPFIILLTIPIGMVGVVWALILHGQPASFMALLGTVAMTGVVVNNAIVLVDFIGTKRKEGLALRDAVIEAGATRLRPIFASSVTTLLGLFPSAYGIGGYEPFVAPMCLALAWGLALAMPMTLFVIPMATLAIDDLRTKLSFKNR